VAGDYDAYDRHVLDRYFSPRWPALPPFLAGYGGAVGLRDLSRYGQWIHVPAWGGYAWRPRGVARSWRPYRDGRWVYTGFGWTWVPREPWGYAPCHYGRWGYVPSHGWLWMPGRRFAPAWVRWGQAGNAVGWGVIGPNDRIVAPPAAIYGSPYVFMSANDFKAGKPVKPIQPKAKLQAVTPADDPSGILEPDPEAKIKAPKLKAGHPAPAARAAEREEQIAFKQSEKTQREAARAADKAGRKKEKGSTEDVATPAVEAPGAEAPARVPAPAVIRAPARSKKAPAMEEAPAEAPEPEPGEEPAVSHKRKKRSREEAMPSPAPVTSPPEGPAAETPPPPSPGVTPPPSPDAPSDLSAPAPAGKAPAGASGSGKNVRGGKHGPKKLDPGEPE
jgi:hypothetical protein